MKSPSPASLVELLLAEPSLAAIATPALERLAAEAVYKVAPRQRALFSEGDVAQGLYVVASGEIKITRQSPDGREQIFYIARAGRSVVEGLRFDGGKYPASAIALRPSTAWLISHECIAQVGREYPDLLLAMVNLRAKRADRNLSLLAELSLRRVPARLAAFILNQVLIRQVQGQDASWFPRVLTTETVAGRLGTVREEVSRGLAWLEREGALRVTPQRVEIADVHRLEQLAYGENNK